MRDHPRQRRFLIPRVLRGAAPRARLHGVPEAESFSQVDLRQHRLRPAHPGSRRQQGGARRGGGKLAAPGRPLERGEGPRSEEHTSELQSIMRISYAVLCSKKKKSIMFI